MSPLSSDLGLLQNKVEQRETAGRGDDPKDDQDRISRKQEAGNRKRDRRTKEVTLCILEFGDTPFGFQ